MKKKALVLSLVVVLVAVAALGATLAYFTDTSAVDNTFTMGNVDIDLVETVAGQEQPVNVNQSFAAMPGGEFVKAPFIVNTGANDAYVFMKIDLTNADLVKAAIEKYDTNPNELSNDDFFTQIFNQLVDGGDWTEWNVYRDAYAWSNSNDTFTIWFYREAALAPNDSTVPLFTGVKIPAEWNQTDLPANTVLGVNITAYGIQADNIANSAAAFTALKTEYPGA